MNAMNPEMAGLSGRWTHSFEEDGAGVQIYRPTGSFAFPPNRCGRKSLDFGRAGEVVIGVPGPDDRPRSTSSSLTALGMNRFRLEGAGAPGQVMEIVEAGADVLKVRFV